MAVALGKKNRQSLGRRPAKARGGKADLKVFLLGPGVGESVVLRLPCGRWGVVDCYQRNGGSGVGTLEFLQSKGVSSLLFFCQTHPHEDHYLGGHRLLAAYAGKIGHLWRHPGFSQKDLAAREKLVRRMHLAARIKALSENDPFARDYEAEYVQFMKAMEVARAALPKECYRRISGETLLLKEPTYEIRALGPTGLDLDEIEDRLTQLDVNNGFVAYSDEDGSFLNRLSVVLHIKFGAANVVLLADAQGSGEDIPLNLRNCCLVKVAHHGSSNGLAAGLITRNEHSYRIGNALVTPYTCSGLPRAEMVSRFRTTCHHVHLTSAAAPATKQATQIPGLADYTDISEAGGWLGFSVTQQGKVSRTTPT